MPQNMERDRAAIDACDAVVALLDGVQVDMMALLGKNVEDSLRDLRLCRLACRPANHA